MRGTTAVAERRADDLGALLSGLVDVWTGHRFTLREDEVWAHADAPDTPASQGWKLHVSATPASAAGMVAAAAPVLLAAGCSFKIARTLREVRNLTGPRCPRGSAGKVLTAYPATDALAVELAGRLDAATAGIPGPRILSDRQLHEGSTVHYRYGAFTGIPLLQHDGELTLALVDPDGGLVPDVRSGTFTPPPWADDPFARATTGAPAARRSQPVLLGGRFAVREAIRHAYKGGVFRAVDTRTRLPVVVKQARAHVAGDIHGRDIRDSLRHEWFMLERLAPTGVVARPVAVFEQAGDLFIAETDLGAPTLRTWITRRVAADRSIIDVLTMLRHVVEAVAAVHDDGVVLRDLTPNNVLVHDDLTVGIVDLELAIAEDAPSDLHPGSGTPAYAAPEQLAGHPAHEAMDLHALGATLLFALTGQDPALAPGGSATLSDWLGQGGRAGRAPAHLADLALRLCGPVGERPPLPSVLTGIDLAITTVRATGWTAPTEGERAARAAESLEPLDEHLAEQAIERLLTRLLAEIDVTGRRVTRPSAFGETALPSGVQHGAAGLLGVLVQAGRLRADERAIEAAGALAGWIERCPIPRGGSVGIHFGHAGPAWALAEAAVLRGDADLLGRAVDRALAIPVSFPGPDIAQGLAGLGLTLVRLTELTGDPRVRARVAEVADRLGTMLVRDAAGVSWRTPRGASSIFAGKRFHGFAHGTAGIGTFLWYAGRVLDAESLRLLAAECATSLVQAAIRRPDGRLLWASGPEEPGPGLPHWCNGSSGVATFLALLREDSDVTARLGAAGLPPLSQVLDGAARAIVAAKWDCGISYCHGLAGNADALLDLVDRSGDIRHTQAGDLLRILWGRRRHDEHGVGVSDEPGRIVADFAVGYSGALSALLRHRHGGPRIWLPGGAR